MVRVNLLLSRAGVNRPEESLDGAIIVQWIESLPTKQTVNKGSSLVSDLFISFESFEGLLSVSNKVVYSCKDKEVGVHLKSH